ncbi:Hypothetical predicted protein [Paramuricea clavata]|uniref:Uncharacterized protein n=1 Tax=Paramuricea clavata TaxID=317549 RepID=A0A6S7INA2_PARCT|nr:Hypothetical predicted protein [Paramuricea clavata]
MDVWSRIKIDEAVGSAKLRKLQKIGDTIWWPKQAALETIFCPYNNKKRNIFCHAKVIYDKHPITCKQVVWITLVLGTWCSHQKTRYTESHMTPLRFKSNGEQASDMLAEDPIVRFRANVFRRVVDQITTSIDQCFSQNGQLIKDTAYLDPRRFDEIVLSGVSENSLTKVAKITGIATMTSTNEEKSSEEESSDNEDGGVSKNPILRNRNAARKGNCKKRLACCHKILFKYSLITSALTNLFVVYEHLLTLSFTQVNCEWAFSKLKQITPPF